MDPQTQLDLSKLSDADKKELNLFLTQEAQKSNIQQSMFLPPLPPNHLIHIDASYMAGLHWYMY